MVAPKQPRPADRVLDARRKARDQVCGALPGKPQDYVYVVTEQCRRRPDTLTEAEKQKKKREAQWSRMSTAREITSLKNEIYRKYGEHYTEEAMSGVIVAFLADVFGLMIRDDMRRRYPDPLYRYDHITQIIDNTKMNKGKIRSDKLPRYTILRLTLEHLETLRKK